jgi:hypothetical protein
MSFATALSNITIEIDGESKFLMDLIKHLNLNFNLHAGLWMFISPNAPFEDSSQENYHCIQRGFPAI